MSRAAKGVTIEGIITLFEKVDFDEKVKIFQGIKEYMTKETEKNLEEARIKVNNIEKLQALLGQ